MAKFIKSDNSLIKKVKEGDEEAKERFFKDNLNYIISKACIYVKKFSHISDDFEEYYSLLYESCLKTIEVYDESRGDFYHLWMRICKREVIRFVKKTLNRKENIKVVAYDSSSELANALTEIELNDYYDKNREFIEHLNNKDLAEKMLIFVRENFKREEYEIFLMWLKGYRYDEIAKKYELTYSCVAARIYHIINVLQYKFKS